MQRKERVVLKIPSGKYPLHANHKVRISLSRTKAHGTPTPQVRYQLLYLMTELTRNIGSVFVLLILTSSVYPQGTIPGARIGSGFWLDSTGPLWIFGGFGYDSLEPGYLGDLWRFEMTNNEWTWIGGSRSINQTRGVYGTRGIASAANSPGSRYDVASWTDSKGNFWLFGGEGFDAANTLGNLNDLWRYDPISNQWTWMHGVNTTNHPGTYETPGIPSNTTFPGGRRRCITWIDSGDNLWLYAGVTVTGTVWSAFNDLWKYNTSSNQWTWVSGTKATNAPRVYGTKGTPSNTTTPGSRYSSAAWIDSQDTLWLFSGSLYSGGLYYTFNDLWSYNTSSNQWTWSGGPGGSHSKGVYGTKGVPTALTTPGTRAFGASWVDTRDTFWLFGGAGSDANAASGALSDLWAYNTSSTFWTWVAGNKVVGQLGMYETQGVPSDNAFPGGRYSSAYWISQNKLWLFGGGYVISNTENSYYYNDLWSYNLSTNQWTWVTGSSTTNQRGVYTGPPLTQAPIALVPVTVSAPIAEAQTPLSEVQAPTSDIGAEVGAEVIVPAVVVPVVGVGAIILGVLLGLRRKQNKKKQMNNTNPLFDKRLIPYNSVTLEREIGAGSYGKVYIGKWQSTKVAVKVGNAAISSDEFIREAEFQLNIPPHPNIVQLLGVSVDGPRPLVVLEYCNEGSLDKQLFDTDEAISTEKQLKIASLIAQGLNHLHKNNVVHRDLAARNILLHNGEAKISDFGLSRALVEEAKVGKTASTTGPIRWMAPESVANQTYSTQSDVWMYGIILYEITARQEPHIGEDVLNVAIQIRDSGLTPTISENSPPVLKEIMQMCWHKDPTMRPTMEQICQKLDDV